MFNFKLPRNLEIPTSLDVPVAGEAVASAAKDAAYIAVGSGVLAFQRAQVASRDLQERLPAIPSMELPDFDLPDFNLPKFDLPEVDVASAVSAGREGVETLRNRMSNLGEIPAVHAIDEQVQVFEDRVDVVLDAVESKLPTPAQFALNTVREAAKDSSAYARTALGLSA